MDWWAHVWLKGHLVVLALPLAVFAAGGRNAQKRVAGAAEGVQVGAADASVVASWPSRASATIDLTAFGEIVVRTHEGRSCLDIVAADLRDHLARMCGAKPAVVSPDQSSGEGPRLVVGDSPLARSLAPDVDPAGLELEEFVVRRSPAGDLVFLGSNDTASMYAVYEFLERLGCRWYSPDDVVVPKVKRATLDLPIHERPAIKWRRLGMNTHRPGLTFSDAYPGYSRERLWAARNKLTSKAYRGGYFPSTGWPIYGTHAIGGMLDQAKDGAAHPEWFSLVNGRRTTSGKWQPCYTAPGLAEHLTGEVLRRMAAGRGPLIDVSQTDCSGAWCRCPACTAVYEQYGAKSAAVFGMMNRIAEQTSKKFPNKYVVALAYNWSKDPPARLTLHPNVYVWQSTIFRSLLRPITESSRGERIVGWGKLTDHLIVWDYVTHFTGYLTPLPDFDVRVADLKFYRDRKVQGIYLQGAKYTGALCDFARLRAYLLARGMWDPDSIGNVQDFCHDFIVHYYGTAAPGVGRYFDLLYGLEKTPDLRDLGGQATHLTPAFLVNGTKALEAARAAADSPERRARVDELRLSLEYAKLNHPELWKTDRELLGGFLALFHGVGSPALHEYAPMDLEGSEFWTHARLQAMTRGRGKNLATEMPPASVDGERDRAMLAKLARVTSGKTWRERETVELQGPKHEFAVDLQTAQPINGVALAAWEGLASATIETSANGRTWTTAWTSQDCPSDMFLVEFPEAEARYVRIALDYTGSSGKWRVRRLAVFNDPASKVGEATVTDYGATLDRPVAARVRAEDFKVGDDSFFRRAELYGRPFYRATVGEDEAREAQNAAASCVEADFSIPEAGLYAIEGLVTAENGTSDSFHGAIFRKGGERVTAGRWKFSRQDFGSFFWDPFERLRLAPGEYVFRISPREKGAGLAGVRAILLSD